MDFTNYIIFGLIAVAVFTAYMAVVSLLRKDRTMVRANKINAGVVSGRDPDDLGIFAQILKQILIALGVDFNNQRDNINRIGRAGYNTHNALVGYLSFKHLVQPIFLLIALVIIAKIMLFHGGIIKENLGFLMGALFIALIGTSGANLFISNASQKRSAELISTFPDALDLVLICVESGLGIDAAFARVCNEMKETHPVVASEFERTRFEMNMMNDRIQALQNFSDRTGVGAVRSLVASLIQAEKFGTSLIDTMRQISEEQRTDRMMQAETKAARLPAMITMPLIFFILPGLFMIILGPAYVKVQQQGGLFGPAEGGR